MKISVIIPTYKPQLYLQDCLRSIASQTFPKKDYEVIIVLNGCDEPYKSKITHFISENMSDINVNFIHTTLKGVSNARNIALENCRGEYIAFIDDDDYVSSQYLELLYLKASENTIPLCYPLSFKDGTKNYTPYLITRDYDKNVKSGKCNFKKARKFFSGPVYKLIPRQVIGDRRFDCRFSNGEDSLFMFLISDKFQYVDFTSKEAVYYRRIRENSAVTIKRPRFSICINELKRMIIYTKIFFSNPFKYSFNFYVTRMLGAMRTMIS